MSPDSYLIVSYPRSGNHLVRALIEAYSHRPTEGCPGSKRDTPIYMRPANAQGLIKINLERPIGYKAHRLREIHQIDRNSPNEKKGMVFITRDPAAAISSQATRILSNKLKYPWLTDRAKRIVIQKQIDFYLALIFRYVSHEQTSRIHVKYEDLISPDTRERVVNELLEKLGTEKTGPTLGEIFDFAKNTQTSIGKSNASLQKEIAKKVRDIITYKEVNDYVSR